MRNIELKKIYWNSSEDKQIEIKNTLLQRSGITKRIKSGNSDYLVHIVESTKDNDENVAVMVKGIFALDELKDVIGKDIF